MGKKLEIIFPFSQKNHKKEKSVWLLGEGLRGERGKGKFPSICRFSSTQ
jgi:hypothetical protein